MSALQKFKTFFSKNVLLCLTVPMVVFSLLVPQPFVWMGQNISIDLSGIPFLKENFPSFGFVNMLLCVIMFGMGLTLTLLVDVLSLVGLVQTLRGLKSPLPGIWRITRAFHPFN